MAQRNVSQRFDTAAVTTEVHILLMNGMHYTGFYADRLFALSPEGVFAG